MLLEKGTVLAPGLHKDVVASYIRFGHMGVSVMDPSRGDVDFALVALTKALPEWRLSQNPLIRQLQLKEAQNITCQLL